MKKILQILTTLGLGFGLISQGVAQDSSFEREFAKFDKDFDRLNSWKADTPASRKMKTAPSTSAKSAQEAPSAATTTPLQDDGDHANPQTQSQSPEPKVNDAPADHLDQGDTTAKKASALPRGAKVERLSHHDRLGNQISDPEMRKKVQALYRRQDVVVQQYVLPTN